MQADADTPRGGHRGPQQGAGWKGFSNGVFGFAITLLVVDIATSSARYRPFLQQALHAWPAYLAYITSFLTIGECVAPPHTP